MLITNMFSKWMRYFLWSMGNSWHDNSSVRKNKKGFWDVGLHRWRATRYFLWLFSRAYSRKTSFPAAEKSDRASDTNHMLISVFKLFYVSSFPQQWRMEEAHESESDVEFCEFITYSYFLLSQANYFWKMYRYIAYWKTPPPNLHFHAWVSPSPPPWGYTWNSTWGCKWDQTDSDTPPLGL